jgi:hypothetical protein
MVDFNSEGAFSANKAHILELVILGRRDELINTFQLWSESKISNSSKEETLKNKLRAVLLSMFLELERPLNRKLIKRGIKGEIIDRENYDFIRYKLTEFDQAVSAEDLIKLYFMINTTLDELNLIKIDNKRAYDSTNVETENEEKGL